MPLGEVWVWQHPCELAMPERWHCSAMRLQQSRSAAVIVAPGTVHAITGRAASSSARIETPALAAKFTPISLVPNICKRQRIEKGFKSSVSWPLLIASSSLPLWMNSYAACDWLQSTAKQFSRAVSKDKSSWTPFRPRCPNHRNCMLYGFSCLTSLALLTACYLTI